MSTYPDTCGKHGGLNRKGEPCGRPSYKGGKCWQHQREPGKSAGISDPVTRPNDWDLAVHAAFLWSNHKGKGKAKAAAEAAGVGLRTIHRWTKSPWWHEAVAEARSRWMREADRVARESLVRGMEADPKLAWEFLQATTPSLAPPTRTIRVVGMMAFVQGLAHDVVLALQSMQPDERRAELLRLAEEAGVRLELPAGEIPA